MANVWYIGEAQKRIVFGQEFNVQNNWSIPENFFTSGQLTQLDADPGFLLGKDGPRDNPPWFPDNQNGMQLWNAHLQELLAELPTRLSDEGLTQKILAVGNNSYATTAQGAKADSAVQPAALTSGLAGKANTTHTHATGDITALTEYIQDAVNDLIQAGANVT